MTGIELIAKEREEQIEKYADEMYATRNKDLSKLVLIILNKDHSSDTAEYGVRGWHRATLMDIKRKPYKERLIIAGALIAAELDRLNDGSVISLLARLDRLMLKRYGLTNIGVDINKVANYGFEPTVPQLSIRLSDLSIVDRSNDMPLSASVFRSELAEAGLLDFIDNIKDE